MGRKNSKKQKNREKSSTGGGKLLRGVLDITRSGTGFVTVEGLETDVLIRILIQPCMAIRLWSPSVK